MRTAWPDAAAFKVFSMSAPSVAVAGREDDAERLDRASSGRTAPVIATRLDSDSIPVRRRLISTQNLTESGSLGTSGSGVPPLATVAAILALNHQGHDMSNPCIGTPKQVAQINKSWNKLSSKHTYTHLADKMLAQAFLDHLRHRQVLLHPISQF